MSQFELYPLKFVPILKDKVWGGAKLQSMFNKASNSNSVGESWELSGVSGNISKVANGPYAGLDLNQLLTRYPVEVLGNPVYSKYGHVFPLLFKFIDAKEDLSVQVHPDDKFAKAKHNSFGKTEMWYIMQADPGAQLIVDFKSPISKSTYLEHLEKKTIASLLNYCQVEQGESYFIPPGTIHAICGGVLLAEIQQTSDITYRVYDWDRPDKAGNYRELHNELAVETLNFNAPRDQQLKYSKTKNEPNDLCKSDFFETKYLDLNQTTERTFAHLDSFVVYMCVSGGCVIELNQNKVTVNTGETVLIPAQASQVTIQTTTAELLEVCVP